MYINIIKKFCAQGTILTAAANATPIPYYVCESYYLLHRLITEPGISENTQSELGITYRKDQAPFYEVIQTTSGNFWLSKQHKN